MEVVLLVGVEFGEGRVAQIKQLMEGVRFVSQGFKNRAIPAIRALLRPKTGALRDLGNAP
jgi:xanthosine utilization system XapX-like protein